MGFSSPIFAVSPFEVSIDSDENVEVISEAVDETSQYNPLDQIEEAYLENLTEEEIELIRMKLLPIYYPQLKLCKERKAPYTGDKGGKEASIRLCKSFFPNVKPSQFSKDFGNIDHMLRWARRIRKDADYVEMIQACKVGDVVLNGPDSPKDIENNMICMMTKGPYFHATLVTHVSPPVMIEAMGITGYSGDSTKDQIRMVMWFEEFSHYGRFRIVRPTQGMPEAEAQRIINKALSYAYQQLGKPYDYAFTDKDNDGAFYCSELVYKAYKSAGLSIANKDPKRDGLVRALQSVIDSLQPKDRFKLSDEIVQFTTEYMSNPDFDKLQKFLIYTVIPQCAVFDKAFPDKKAYDRLNRTVNLIKADKAMPNYKKASQQYKADKASGRFKTPFGIGFVREKAAKLRIANAIRKDVNKIVQMAGVSKKEFLKIAFQLFMPIYKHTNSIGELVGGLARQQNVELPAGIDTVMEIIDWVNDRREVVADWPLIGKPLSKLMPGSAEGLVSDDFTSPTDLAFPGKDKIIIDWPK